MKDFILIYNNSNNIESLKFKEKFTEFDFNIKIQNYEIFYNKGFDDYESSSIFNNEDYTFISNSRIINHEYLLQKYNIKYTNDSKLIFDLYKIHGVNFVDIIEGPFSVIIIENKKKLLRAYSDHFSSKPIFYSKLNNSLIFSNSVRRLRDCLNINDIDEEILIDYLISGVPRAKRTIYKNINIIPANTELYIQNKLLRLRKFQSIKTILTKDSLEVIKEKIFTIFKNVLTDELSRSKDKVAFSLSGGLDSSSIVCMANEINNFQKNIDKFSSHSATFSKLSKDQKLKTDESAFIEDVVNKTKIKSYKYKFKDRGSLSLIDELVDVEEPALGPNLYINFRILKSLKDKKIRTLIEGIGGDSAISHGHGLFFLLGKRLKVFKLLKEYKAYCLKQNLNFSYWNCIKKFVITPRVPDFIHVNRYKKDITRNDYFNANNFLKDEFKIDIGKRFHQIHDYHPKLATSFKYDPYFYEELSTNDLFEPYASRTSYHIGRKFNVEIVFPFNDRRIRNYCIDIPYEFKMNNGIDRFYFRNSMHNIIPKSIQNRIWKSDISPLFLYEMKKMTSNEIINLVFENNKYFKKLLDKEKLKKMFDQFKATGDQKFATTLYKYIYLAMWLKKNTK